MKIRTTPTEEEIRWWRSLQRLIDNMPCTMRLHADGELHGVDRAAYEASSTDDTVILQPLDLSPGIYQVDGGDPWWP